MNHSVQKKENAFLKKFSRTDLLLLAVCLLFYLLFPIFDGPVWCKDSLSYAGKDISREPLYPMFLALMKVLDGAEISASGMMAAVIVQSLIAGFATWYAGYVVKKTKNESRVLQLRQSDFSLPFRFSAVLPQSEVPFI